MSGIKRYIADFDSYFDNNHGDVVIGQYTFSASEVLNQMNPVAYNEEFNYWLKTYSGVMND
jgi:hypothetical protein